MRINDIRRAFQEFDVAEKLEAIFRVAPHDLPFVVVELRGFEQNTIRNFQLTDIVQQRSMFDLNESGALDTQSACGAGRQVRDPAGVAARALIAEIQRHR